MVSMDRKLVSSKEQYEVKYFTKKLGLSAADARSVLQPAGRGRERADEFAAAEKRARH